ncbi:MAG TPA: hypothetical protein ENJ79_11725 [Gammaproteobacteria bacterium]|nr:hypothetical protein [Gammaproteobacteria bacterium]
MRSTNKVNPQGAALTGYWNSTPAARYGVENGLNPRIYRLQAALLRPSPPCLARARANFNSLFELVEPRRIELPTFALRTRQKYKQFEGLKVL